MNIFLEEDETTEIKPIDESQDKAVVINPEVGKRGEGVSDLAKEIIALDTLIIGSQEASKVHGVPQSSASKYSNGKDIADPNTRAAVLNTKYEIGNVAITKLMETLDLINPQMVDKPRDQIALVTGLSNLVEKITGGDKDKDRPEVHLHLYAPNQKQVKDYEVIDV